MTHMVLQAITTRYHGPTSFKGSRISAKAAAGRITIAYPHELSMEASHAKAARALAEKLGWGGAWYQGGSPDGAGYCFVQVIPCGEAGTAPAFTTVAAEG